MNKSILALAAIATLASAAPAAAQSFTGPRVEGRVGYDNFENSRADGVTYGGGVGYDVAVGRDWRVGVEGGIEGSTADERFGRTTVEAGRDLSVGARLGYVVNDRVLLYGTGGYTNQRIEARNLAARAHGNADGWRVGGGAEYAATPRTYVRAEYRHSDYEGRDGGRNQGIVGFGYRF